MQENIGLGLMTETPCVVVNVSVAARQTGLPTLTGQTGYDAAPLGLARGTMRSSPLSPLPRRRLTWTVTLFNLSEKVPCPGDVHDDECVGHMTEKVIIPDATPLMSGLGAGIAPQGQVSPYAPDKDGVPPMIRAGDDHRVHITGLTTNEPATPSLTPSASTSACRGSWTRYATTLTTDDRQEKNRWKGGRRGRRNTASARAEPRRLPSPQEGHQSRLPAAHHGLAVPEKKIRERPAK